ncbi:hypothetical protein [Prosthecodimorpha staleyi]|uniref:Uncharacterized protein n=1 Tax=Prosthecodimorpha staleyi TaxID=2840188 RepID=A0A947DD60_9HYPH|nr:hypothetical protein [Prosthecodimorpha staleyi]MBT9293159.1 hypothetical protein [Prosthecodimorpha staleyi]
MDIVFLGDSHIWSLVKGVKSINPSLKVKSQPLGAHQHLCDSFFTADGSSITITKPELTKYVQSLPLPGYENAPHIVSIGFHSAHFTRVARNFGHLDTLKRERWAISTATWDAIIEAKQRPQMEFLRALKKVVSSVVVAEAPRLFAASEYCQGQNLDTIRFIDNRVREIFASFLEKECIPAVRLLPHMIDIDGFMSPEYRSNKDGDQHHANSKIGEELAPYIFSTIFGFGSTNGSLREVAPQIRTVA